MTSKDIIHDIEGKMQKCVESAKREFAEVRTGRAHPGLIEGLHVQAYGSNMMLKELAAISIPDPKMIMIQPWDPSIIADIEKAVQNSALALTPMSDGKTIRLPIPQLSQERRKELQKIVKDMAERSRVALRTIRREANDKIKKSQGEKLISEDESFRAQETIQKSTDKSIAVIDGLLEDKNKSLME